METFGGGKVNVIALLLRVVMIKRFKKAKCLVLDESFANLSAEYLPKVSEMLRSLCDDYGYSILMITHQEQLATSAHTIYRAAQSEAGPTLTEISAQELNASDFAMR